MTKWETLNKPDFKPHIYEGFKSESAKPHLIRWLAPKNNLTEVQHSIALCTVAAGSGRAGRRA